MPFAHLATHLQHGFVREAEQHRPLEWVRGDGARAARIVPELVQQASVGARDLSTAELSYLNERGQRRSGADEYGARRGKGEGRGRRTVRVGEGRVDRLEAKAKCFSCEEYACVVLLLSSHLA